jgi:hypothetical protein
MSSSSGQTRIALRKLASVAIYPQRWFGERAADVHGAHAGVCEQQSSTDLGEGQSAVRY